MDDRLTAFLKKFLGSMNESSLEYQNWYRNMNDIHIPLERARSPRSQHIPTGLSKFAQLRPPSLSCLAISTFGFYQVIRDWWTTGFKNVNQRNKRGYTLLQLGVEGGNEAIVKLLLDNGADINAQGKHSGTALSSAVLFGGQGKEAMVRLLLDRGADLGGGMDFYVLEAAVCQKNEAMVRLVLEAMKNTIIPTLTYGRVLRYSCFRFSVWHLMCYMRSAGLQRRPGEAGLEYLRLGNREKTTCLPLEAMKNVNVPTMYYKDAFCHAVMQNVWKQSRRILEAMIKLNLPSDVYSDMLYDSSMVLVYCSNRPEQLVRLLLEMSGTIDVERAYQALRGGPWSLSEDKRIREAANRTLINSIIGRPHSSVNQPK